MQTVKEGDKFKLGPWTWEVFSLGESTFLARKEDGCSGAFMYENASSLDWIKEPATISKAAKEEISEWLTDWGTRGVNCVALEIKLASMVRDGE